MADVSDGRLVAAEDPALATELTWVCHPLRYAHRKTIMLVLVVVATALLIGINTESLMWGVASAAILLLGVYDYIFATHYRLTEWGVESRVLLLHRRKRWSMLRSAHPDRNGVLLSPFAGRSRLEAFRGIYLRFAGNRDEVLGFLRARVGERRV